MRQSAVDPSDEQPTNAEIADRLDEVSDLLEQQSDVWSGLSAWRCAAMALRSLRPAASDLLLAEGIDGLLTIPGVAPAIAHAIRELIDTGDLPALDWLRAQHRLVEDLATVPGIGWRRATRIFDQLGIRTTGELERAIADGRLATISGIGPRGAESIGRALARLRMQREHRRTPWLNVAVKGGPDAFGAAD